jgi:hypothetical protein
LFEDIHSLWVAFIVSHGTSTPDEISESLGLVPDRSHSKGEVVRARDGSAVGVNPQNYWGMASTSRTESKDPEEHFRVLLQLLIPKAEVIHGLAENNRVWFYTVWTSDELVRGSGFSLSAEVCAGIAQLRAGLDFEVAEASGGPSGVEEGRVCRTRK